MSAICRSCAAEEAAYSGIGAARRSSGPERQEVLHAEFRVDRLLKRVHSGLTQQTRLDSTRRFEGSRSGEGDDGVACEKPRLHCSTEQEFYD